MTSSTRLASALAVGFSLVSAVPASAQAAPEIGLSRAALEGRHVSVTARCTGTEASLRLTSVSGAKLGTATAPCRGTTRLRATLARSVARRLAAPGAPDVRVTVRSGAARDSARVSFARVEPPGKGGTKARAAAGGTWPQVRANCNQLTHGNPPWSHYVIRQIEFGQHSETFGYRYGTVLTWRGMALAHNPNGSQHWVFLNEWTQSPAGYAGNWFGYTLPLSHNWTGWVRPAVQLYNGDWNYTIAESLTQATASAGWCYFPVPY